jgi:hypothetical protein
MWLLLIAKRVSDQAGPLALPRKHTCPHVHFIAGWMNLSWPCSFRSFGEIRSCLVLQANPFLPSCRRAVFGRCLMQPAILSYCLEGSVLAQGPRGCVVEPVRFSFVCVLELLSACSTPWVIAVPCFMHARVAVGTWAWSVVGTVVSLT